MGRTKTPSVTFIEAKQSEEIADLKRQLASAEGMLYSIGYQGEVDYNFPLSRSNHYFWKLSAAATAERAAEKKAAIATAREIARRETLEKVIEALDLKGYKTRRDDILSHIIEAADRARLAPGGIPIPRGADKLWADIETALEVREENKRAEARKATEAKVSNLSPGLTVTKYGYPTLYGFDPGLLPSGGIVSNHGDLFDRSARPENGSVGHTGPVAGTAKPAKKKSKKDASK